MDKPKPTVPIANHFTLYLFDDLHLKFGDLAQVRAAAVKHFEETMRETDRVGIFTTSGQTRSLDFTDDRGPDSLNAQPYHARLVTWSGRRRLSANSLITRLISSSISRIAQALQVAAEDTVICMNLSGPGAQTTAQGLAQAAASRMISTGEHSSRLALVTLKAMIKRLSVMPGERSIVLASPGFLVLDTTHSDSNRGD